MRGLPARRWLGRPGPDLGLLTGESHIPLAATPHYRNAAPITGGFYGHANTEFDFEMKVTRVAEHPRITKPFSDESWQELDALGHKVDSVLQVEDVRLTMGGEPTFVSIDDFQSGEWNTDAVGPTKRAKADVLIRRLRERFAPGGFLHYGQGKWYPGESLPRWTFSLYWRKDGIPIWSNPDLIAVEARDHKVTHEDAAQLLQAIAVELDIPTDNVTPAMRIRRSGSSRRPIFQKMSILQFEAEGSGRAQPHCQGVFRGLTEPAGYVLPVQAWQARVSGRTWVSEKWRTRRGRLYLVPGDSPVGFRLPLNSLPYISPSWYPYINPTDPTVASRPCRTFRRKRAVSCRSILCGAISRSSSKWGSPTRRSAGGCAPPFQSKCAMVGSASSCRRRPHWRTISTSSHLRSAPPPPSVFPSISKATPRPMTSAST